MDLPHLPQELKDMIFEHGSIGPNAASFTPVCRAWKEYIEKHNTFRSLKLTSDDLGVGTDTESLIPQVIAYRILGREPARLALVRHIDLLVRLNHYDCPNCQYTESIKEWVGNRDIIDLTIYFLFQLIKEWPKTQEGLTLDITVTSPDDRKQLACTRAISAEKSNKVHSIPRGIHLYRSHNLTMFLDEDFWAEHGKVSVPAVTKLLVRRENERRWFPFIAPSLLANMTGLEELHLEIWRELSNLGQFDSDAEMQMLLESIREDADRILPKLKALTIFEEFKPDYYIPTYEFEGPGVPLSFIQRPQNVELGRDLALTVVSRGVERVSVSFMVEGSDVLEELVLLEEWESVKSVTLTSKLLCPLWKKNDDIELETDDPDDPVLYGWVSGDDEWDEEDDDDDDFNDGAAWMAWNTATGIAITGNAGISANDENDEDNDNDQDDRPLLLGDSSDIEIQGGLHSPFFRQQPNAEFKSPVTSILVTAARAVRKMPNLEVIEIWNGGNRGLAGVFRFHVEARESCADHKFGVITWRGNWIPNITDDIRKAWEQTVRVLNSKAKTTDWGPNVSDLDIVMEQLDENVVIRSHADAILHLKIQTEVIHPKSLSQMLKETDVQYGLAVDDGKGFSAYPLCPVFPEEDEEDKQKVSVRRSFKKYRSLMHHITNVFSNPPPSFYIWRLFRIFVLSHLLKDWRKEKDLRTFSLTVSISLAVLMFILIPGFKPLRRILIYYLTGRR
ncbi:hypothetical protein QBC38DRAFT_6867 [Podospora fimiseda]|uniref:F-box domain-containing protein n=1 Tax=Podospora fimiseda TaxID=252190 RepID=A0AAN7C066_9PEZI|nr:hypothetical protein QBC38DRAFT_6867 [Podospora fimiseda]